jgi:hypothetical protein
LARRLLYGFANMNSLASLLLVSSLLVGCATNPADDTSSPDEQGDSTGSGSGSGNDNDEPCTAATDVLPYNELAASLSSLPIGDIVRATDGTVYFISGNDGQSATIGRRAVCGAIEKDWLDITAPISDLEISSDNVLYMAGSGSGSVDTVRGRLYALDLSDPTAFPAKLVDQPGETLQSLSAGPDGKLFFLQGWNRNALRIVDGGSVTPKVAVVDTDMNDVDSVDVAPDGSLLFTGNYYGAGRVARMSFGGTVPTLTVQSIPKQLFAITADINGGYYAQYATGYSPSYTVHLVHASSPTATPTEVASAVAEHVRYYMGIDGEADSALRVAPSLSAPVTTVALPVPVL